MAIETSKSALPDRQPLAEVPSLDSAATPSGNPAPGSAASWREIAAAEQMLLPQGLSRSMQDYYDNEATAAARFERDGK